ncbi:MAG TPA: UxaA family hydrolase [Streptosporangiaceae bacterium]|jgi:(2R)-sulfolactate sulfo-lyase subunit alpha
MPTASPPPDFLAHDEGDSVAVAMRDLQPGPVEGGYLAGPQSLRLELSEPVPLGHKFALRPLAAGEEVIEYGVPVAVTTAAIEAGQHAHVHNLRSIRWQTSTAG